MAPQFRHGERTGFRTGLESRVYIGTRITNYDTAGELVIAGLSGGCTERSVGIITRIITGREPAIIGDGKLD